jgi:glycerol-3-phosphate cytidylyltransferase
MIIDRKDIGKLAEKLRAEGKSIVFTNGCFDILHSGHIFYLQKAKQLSDILILGLNSDASVKRLKGEKRPINSEMDRAIVISELKSVDYVVIFDEDTPLELIAEILPNILVKGGDYKKEDVVGKDIVESGGGEVIIIPFVDGKSTTNIINRING